MYEACLGCPQTSRSLPPRARILKVYIQVLTGFRYVSYPDQQNVALSRLSLKPAPIVGMVGGAYILRTGERVRSLWWHRSSSWVNQ